MEKEAPPAKKGKLPDFGIKDLSEFIDELEQRSPEQTKNHQSAKEYYHRKTKSADNDDAMQKVAHAHLGDLARDASDLEAAAFHYKQTGVRISRFEPMENDS